MAAVGLTAVHGMDGTPATHDELRELEARGELCVRIVAPLHVEVDTPWEELERWTQLRDEHGERWRGGVAKFFIDGVVEPGTAWLEEPDTSGAACCRCGPIPSASPARSRCSRGAGFQCATHAIGDRAVRCTLDAYREAGAAAGIRHRIEHIETLGDEQLARFAAEGVVASMQAIHLQWMRADGSDPWSRALGPERAGRAFRCADLVAERRAAWRSARTGRSPTSTRARAWPGRACGARPGDPRRAADRPGSGAHGRAGPARLHERRLARGRRGGTRGPHRRRLPRRPDGASRPTRSNAPPTTCPTSRCCSRWCRNAQSTLRRNSGSEPCNIAGLTPMFAYLELKLRLTRQARRRTRWAFVR